MERIESGLEGVYIIQNDVFGDSRGFFTESYHREKLSKLGCDYAFVQDNHSFSESAGVIRGLHYQLEPAAQTKLVRVAVGAIYDVAVDIRKNSPNFGRSVGVILTAENHRMLLIPRGFAHGFCTLVQDTHVLYKADKHYSPSHDRGIIWNDPTLNIDWPVSKAVLSDRDTKHPRLVDAEVFD